MTDSVDTRRWIRVKVRNPREAASALPAALRPEAERLLARVAGEVSGSGLTLASEVYRSVTHGQQSEDVSAIALAELGALELDILGMNQDSATRV